MPSLPLPTTFLLLLLALLPPSTPATIPQNTLGRLPGSLTGPHPGDYFTDTRCHCIAQNTTTTLEFGHIYQWTYYNHHLNATFVLSTEQPFIHQSGWCREYPPPPKVGAGVGVGMGMGAEKNDTMCWYYEWVLDGDWRFEDYVTFNGQMRGLGRKHGGQGYLETADALVDGDICPGLCAEFVPFDMEGARAERRYGKGRQVVYVDMDDMCDGCA